MKPPQLARVTVVALGFVLAAGAIFTSLGALDAPPARVLAGKPQSDREPWPPPEKSFLSLIASEPPFRTISLGHAGSEGAAPKTHALSALPSDDMPQAIFAPPTEPLPATRPAGGLPLLRPLARMP